MNPIKKLRKAAGFTQKQLATRLGVCECAVRKWENGGITPRGETLFNLSRLLGCDIEVIRPAPKRPRILSIEERNDFVLQYMDYAKSMISHMWPVVAATRMDTEDLLQELAERLIRAIDTYDPTKGASLKTHIHQALRCEILTNADETRARGITEIPDKTRITVCSYNAMEEAGMQIAG